MTYLKEAICEANSEYALYDDIEYFVKKHQKKKKNKKNKKSKKKIK